MSTAEQIWAQINEEIIEEELNESGNEIDEEDTPRPVGIASENGSNVGLDSELFEGKCFNSLKEAELFYIEYAGKRGYSIRKRKPYKRGKGSELSGYMYTCSCEGTYTQKNTNVQRNRSHMRKECKARMSIHRVRNSNIWKVRTFVDEHSHELVSPSKQVLLRSNRKMSESAKKLSECFRDENIPVSKVPTMFGDTSILGFNSRDCWNHLRNIRDKYNDDGDAEGVRAFFEDKVVENPHFYYAIDIDDKGRAVNFFWVDARARISYGQFGDVVIFDTTYKTNKYSMPFAPFTGINHHQQSILFGCALIENEVEESFVWVFQKWLDAMGGKAPISIVTDQDKAMQKAIAKVFPETRHRFCLWHIMKKFAEKLANVYSKHASFQSVVDVCLYKTYTTDEFDEKWMGLIREYGLQDNNWLGELYNSRKYWVPAYCRDTFFAGTRTTQRSESMNHYFDGFVTKKTNLQTFVRKYEQALGRIYEKERDEDYISIHMERILRSKDPLLEHASKVYTRKMFDKFAKQFEYVCRLRAAVLQVDGNVSIYKVCWRTDNMVEFRVEFDSSSNIGSCSCRKFEFAGMPCKHLLKVFDRLQLDEIPICFIINRWTKRANKGNVVDQNGTIIRDLRGSTTASRTSILSRYATQISSVAGKSEEGFKLFYSILDSAFSQVKELDDTLLQKEHDNTFMLQPCQNSDPVVDQACMSGVNGAPILNPKISQTKGRNKTTKDKNIRKELGNKRFKSGIELSQRKKRKGNGKGDRRCAICGGVNVGHDARNCHVKDKRIGGANDAQKDDEEIFDLDTNDVQLQFLTSDMTDTSMMLQ